MEAGGGSGPALLVEGAMLRCVYGTSPSVIRRSGGHGFQVNGKNVINETDAEFGRTFSDFNVCLLKDIPCDGAVVGERWISTESGLVIGGEPAVTMTACCICSYGGIIYPEDTGQDDVMAVLGADIVNKARRFGISQGLFRGDPIDVCTGNLVDQKTDLQISGSIPFKFYRTYNALDRRVGALGKGWRHSFEIVLEDKKDLIEVTLEDGQVCTFNKVTSDYYINQSNKQSNIRRISNQGYKMVTELESVYFFDQAGKCFEIYDKYGNQTTFNYKEDCLVGAYKVSGGFTFDYNEDGLLTSATDSAGRTVYYHYDRFDTLVTVDGLAGTKMVYQYDSSHRLMVFGDAMDEPLMINTYDKYGRTLKQYYPDGGVVQFEYDKYLNKTIYTEQNGNRVRYYQNDAFQNVKTVYYDGFEETDYNDSGLKTRFRDKNGNEFFYGYDNAGNLIQEINPLGQVTVFEYNKRNALTKRIDADGSEECLEYCENIVQITNVLGHQLQVEYNRGLPCLMTLQDGSQYKIMRDNHLNISSIRSPMGAMIRYKYDKLNRPISMIDGNGGITKYVYNDRDALERIIDANGNAQTFKYTSKGLVLKKVDFDGSVVEYKYNSMGKVEEVIDQAGGVTKIAYDLMWNIISITDPGGNSIQYSYDKLNRVKQMVDAEGNVTKYEYDPKGNVRAIISPLGARTEIFYDALDRQVKVIEPDGATTEYRYDAVGNVIEMIDPLGNIMKREYDLGGQLVSIIDPLGNKTTFTYTSLGDIASITNACGEIHRYEYYPGGLIKAVYFPTGASEHYKYDNNENVIEKMNQSGAKTMFRYDVLNRVIEIINPMGDSKKFFYDVLGNIIKAIDENGGVTQYKYSVLGDIIEVIDAAGHSTKYEYDKVRRLTKLEQLRFVDDALAEIQVQEYQVTTYEYNRNGKIVAVQTPLGILNKFVYDGEGRLISKLDGDGFETVYEYDIVGNLERMEYADGKTVDFIYNPLKQLVEAQDWLGKIQIELDPLGRAKKIMDFDGNTVEYAWDNVGRREKTIYPNGEEVRYVYNPVGLLETICAPEGETRYIHDQLGRVIERILPNKIRSLYEFDAMGRLKEFSHRDDYDVLEHFDYSYDSVGNTVQVRKERKGVEVDSGLFQYSYDLIGRLTSEKHKQKEKLFYYDTLGNRVRAQCGEEMTQYAYNLANQLVQMQVGDVRHDYQYDGRGNLKNILENDVLRKSFVFDATNRMIDAMIADEHHVRYTYDGFLNRVKKQESSVVSDDIQETQYILDRVLPYDNLLMMNGIQKQRFTWGKELLSVSGERDMFYLLDHLGSPLRLRHNWDTTFAYDVFGKQTEGVNASVKQPFGFTGYQVEQSTEMYFAQARYYDGNIGRFVSEDIVKGNITSPRSLNLYVYCWGQPLTLVDSDGRSPCTPSQRTYQTERQHSVGASIVDENDGFWNPQWDYGIGPRDRGSASMRQDRSIVGNGNFTDAINNNSNNDNNRGRSRGVTVGRDVAYVTGQLGSTRIDMGEHFYSNINVGTGDAFLGASINQRGEVRAGLGANVSLVNGEVVWRIRLPWDRRQYLALGVGGGVGVGAQVGFGNDGLFRAGIKKGIGGNIVVGIRTEIPEVLSLVICSTDVDMVATRTVVGPQSTVDSFGSEGAANGTLRSTTTTFDAERNVNVTRTTVGPGSSDW